MTKENYKSLLLVCASGITTGLLVRSIQQNIDKRGLPIHVFSAPSIIAKQIIRDDDVDAILIGPHIPHELNRLKDLLNYEDVAYQLISEESYRLLDGEDVLEQGIKLLGMKSDN